MSIHFFSEEIEFELNNQSELRRWLHTIRSHFKKKNSHLNYIFCSGEYLLRINQEYLRHDYYTDVITFDYSVKGQIEGDIFISVDQVKENSKNEGIPFDHELARVMAHGLLHLLGFNDKSPKEKKVMTEKEEWSLSLLPVNVPRGTSG